MRFSLESVALLALASGVFAVPVLPGSSSETSSDASSASASDSSSTSSSAGGAQKAIVVTAMQGSVNFKTLTGEDVGGYKLIAIDSPKFAGDVEKQAKAIKAKVHEPKTMIVTSAHTKLREALKAAGVEFVSACPEPDSKTMETEYAANLEKFGLKGQVDAFKKNWPTHSKSCAKPATYAYTLKANEKVSDPKVVEKIAAMAQGSTKTPGLDLNEHGKHAENAASHH